LLDVAVERSSHRREKKRLVRIEQRKIDRKGKEKKKAKIRKLSRRYGRRGRSRKC